jgi:DNA-binding XRE family transcriptional regulator
VEEHKTIIYYRRLLSWSKAELQRRAGINYETLSFVERGKWTQRGTVAKIVSAINKGLAELGQNKITVADIHGLRILGEKTTQE